MNSTGTATIISALEIDPRTTQARQFVYTGNARRAVLGRARAKGDESGEHIGTIHSFWSDENTGKLEFLGIRTGWFFGKTHVVPVQGVQFEEEHNAIQVPDPANFIKEAPNFAVEDDLSEAEEDEIYNYYGIKGASTQPAVTESARSDGAAIRPAPDAEASSAEMALHEDQLKVGKRNVVDGQVRLHKIVRTEEVNVPVELKSEHGVIKRIPASEAKGTGATSFNEKRIEIPLSREEAVVRIHFPLTAESELVADALFRLWYGSPDYFSKSLKRRSLVVAQRGEVPCRCF